ncbi:MAG: lipopolysaccharide transport periplasmic protein LptA [Gammaproteobacteria bacterium]|nr:lipopolysaccharide transport periplasmic protein LptA [Gammaproteobacteria bacterium]
MFNRTSRPPLSAETRSAGLGWPATALAVALVCAPALGGAPVLGLPEDAEQPLSIDADSGTYDDDPNGTLELSGNVRLRQGTLRMEAARVRATKRDGKLYRVVAMGGKDAPVRFQQQINPGEPLARAHAQTVDYSIAEERIKLTGDAFLSTGETEYAGGTIVWDMKENAVDCRDGCRYIDARKTPD